MARPRSIVNTFNAPNSNRQFSEGQKSKGILDDYAVRGSIATKEGTIIKEPVNPKDIVNKEYVDGLKLKFDDAFNLVLTTPDTEFSQAIPSDTKKIRFKMRNDSGSNFENQTYADLTLRWSWEAGKVATPTTPYFTLNFDEEYMLDGLNITGATLYFASTGTNNIVEIETWD